MIKYDESGDPYLFVPGDMGVWGEPRVYCHDAAGNPVHVRPLISQGKYTGGFNADGSPTEAMPDSRGWVSDKSWPRR